MNEVGKEYTIFELLIHKQELWDAVSAEISLADILESPLGTYGVRFYAGRCTISVFKLFLGRANDRFQPLCQWQELEKCAMRLSVQ